MPPQSFRLSEAMEESETMQSGMKGTGALSNMKELPEGFVPGDNDVICSWARQNHKHSGNVRFRKLVDEYAPAYVSADTKYEKTNVIAALINKIRGESPNGGFVKKDFYSGRWFEIGLERARDKVGHAVRKAADDLLREKEGKGKRKKAKGQQSSLCEPTTMRTASLQQSYLLPSPTVGQSDSQSGCSSGVRMVMSHYADVSRYVPAQHGPTISSKSMVPDGRGTSAEELRVLGAPFVAPDIPLMATTMPYPETSPARGDTTRATISVLPTTAASTTAPVPDHALTGIPSFSSYPNPLTSRDTSMTTHHQSHYLSHNIGMSLFQPTPDQRHGSQHGIFGPGAAALDNAVFLPFRFTNTYIDQQLSTHRLGDGDWSHLVFHSNRSSPQNENSASDDSCDRGKNTDPHGGGGHTTS